MIEKIRNLFTKKNEHLSLDAKLSVDLSQIQDSNVRYYLYEIMKSYNKIIAKTTKVMKNDKIPIESKIMCMQMNSSIIKGLNDSLGSENFIKEFPIVISTSKEIAEEIKTKKFNNFDEEKEYFHKRMSEEVRKRLPKNQKDDMSYVG